MGEDDVVDVERVGTTGSRLGGTPAQLEVVSRLLRALPDTWRYAHHGDCEGWDEQFHDLARAYPLVPAVRVIGHPPVNPRHRAFCRCDELRPEAEYLVRNARLVAELAESRERALLIACPATSWEARRSGTWATVRYARQANVPRLVIRPDGGVYGDEGLDVMEWLSAAEGRR